MTDRRVDDQALIFVPPALTLAIALVIDSDLDIDVVELTGTVTEPLTSPAAIVTVSPLASRKLNAVSDPPAGRAGQRHRVGDRTAVLAGRGGRTQRRRHHVDIVGDGRRDRSPGRSTRFSYSVPPALTLAIALRDRVRLDIDVVAQTGTVTEPLTSPAAIVTVSPLASRKLNAASDPPRPARRSASPCR